MLYVLDIFCVLESVPSISMQLRKGIQLMCELMEGASVDKVSDYFHRYYLKVHVAID